MEAFESGRGNTLYFNRSHEYGSLFSVSTSGGVERELPGSPKVKSGYWTVNRNGIYFLDLADEQAIDRIKVKLFDPVTRKIQIAGTINQAASSIIQEISVRTDGREIVWSRMERAADLMLVDNFQ